MTVAIFDGGEPEASIRLSWPHLHATSRPLVEPILALRKELADKGADIDGRLDEAAAIAPELEADFLANPGLTLGAMIGLAHQHGRDKIVSAANGSGLPGFGDWAEQLIAESTGRLGQGVLPIVTEGLTAVGFATAGADAEPDVVIDGIRINGHNLDVSCATTLAAVPDALSAAAPELGYVSVQAYLDRHADASAANQRAALARRSTLQTTFDWGPRFLHSTGQYHKGGHQNGVFLQITGEVNEDLEIPGRPYSLATLQAAQAAGDAAVLAGKGRPVLHLHLTDRAVGLGRLLAAL